MRGTRIQKKWLGAITPFIGIVLGGDRRECACLDELNALNGGDGTHDHVRLPLKSMSTNTYVADHPQSSAGVYLSPLLHCGCIK